MLLICINPLPHTKQKKISQLQQSSYCTFHEVQQLPQTRMTTFLSNMHFNMLNHANQKPARMPKRLLTLAHRHMKFKDSSIQICAVFHTYCTPLQIIYLDRQEPANKNLLPYIRSIHLDSSTKVKDLNYGALMESPRRQISSCLQEA